MKLTTFNVMFLLTLCRTYGYYFGMDTPDVAKAKADHFAAHAAAIKQSNPTNYNHYNYNPIVDNPFTNQFISTSVVTDTPEIAKAKAEHFASHAAINPSAKFSNFVPKNVVNPYSTLPSNPAVPDTPEVARAKAEHLAAKFQILRSNPPTTTEHSIQNVEQPNSGLVDMPEVVFRHNPEFQYKAFPQQAKDVHFAPKSNIYETGSSFSSQHNIQDHNSHVPQYHDSILYTPEVAKARAEHFAVKDALYRSLPKLVENYEQTEIKPSYVSEQNYQNMQEIQHNNPNIHKLNVNYHPIQVRPEYIQIQHHQQPEITYITTTMKTPEYVAYIEEHGKVNPIVPRSDFESPQILGDTLEVARARAEHYAAHAALGNPAVGGLKDYALTQTLGDTPEVAKAKAEHFAAHMAARYQL